jgi:FMN reductase
VGATVELITGRDLELPIYDVESADRTPGAVRFLEALRRADGLIIASPGYHGLLSGLVKNALDYAEDLRHDPRPYLEDVAVGCVAVARGWQATVSTLHSLRAAVHALRGWPTPLGVVLNSSERTFDDHGRCVVPSVNAQLTTVGRQVATFAMLRRQAAAPA